MPELQPWEFLIQQDGDRAWLPLNGSTVEILEGRYRIAAKTNRQSAAIEVRIRHDAIEELPPKRRTQTRTHQTNPKGLMPVIPFTRLQPGIWEFQCALKEGGAHSLQLRVVSIESDLVQDWNPDWEGTDEALYEVPSVAPEPKAVETKVVDADRAAIEEFLQQADQESSSIADEILAAYGLVAEEPDEADQVPNVTRSGGSNLAIELGEEIYIAYRGEPLTISGQITSTEITHLDAELQICLRDPQTSEILIDQHEILRNQALPFDLVYRVTIPVELETQLILGEITLYDTQAEEHPIVATESFTLMSDIDRLIEAMHQAQKDDRAIAEDLLDLPATKSAEPQPLNLAFLNLVSAPKDPEAANFAPKDSQTLPPQLHQPSPYNRKKLNLPSFGVQPETLSDPEAKQLEIPLASAPISTETEIEEPVEAVIEAPLFPIEQPIHEVKVQAADRDLHALDEAPPDLQPSPDATIDEFVVDDEPILPLANLIVSRRHSQGSSNRVQNPLLLPETEPVPDPIVTIAESELTRGKTAIVRIKLPDILPKIYVKAWVSDRQSRSLIEPPRWIIDFKPDGHHNMEAIAEVKVPFDSVEIRIEAIAVEALTNRESRKVVIDRPVILEELPDLWSEGLDADSIVSP